MTHGFQQTNVQSWIISEVPSPDQIGPLIHEFQLKIMIPSVARTWISGPL